MGKLTVTDSERATTPAELRLLKVLQNPDNFGKNPTDKAKLADISRTYYYEMIKKPHFQELMKRTSTELLVDDLFPITEALKKKAKEGSYNHIKLYFDMLGISPSKKIDVTVHQGIEKHLKEWQEYQEYMKSMGEEVTDIDVEYSIEEE